MLWCTSFLWTSTTATGRWCSWQCRPSWAAAARPTAAVRQISKRNGDDGQTGGRKERGETRETIKRERVYVCMCVCVRERERERIWSEYGPKRRERREREKNNSRNAEDATGTSERAGSNRAENIPSLSCIAAAAFCVRQAKSSGITETEDRERRRRRRRREEEPFASFSLPFSLSHLFLSSPISLSLSASPRPPSPLFLPQAHSFFLIFQISLVCRVPRQ